MSDLKERIRLAIHVLRGLPLMYKINMVDSAVRMRPDSQRTPIVKCSFTRSMDAIPYGEWNDDIDDGDCDHAGCFHNEQELPGMWENADFIDNSEQDVKQPLSVPLWAFGLAEDPEDSWEDSNETESEYILRRTENVLVTKANKGYIWKNLDYEED